MSSFFLTKELAAQAIDLVRPIIEKMVATGVTAKPGDLKIVVLDSTKVYGTCNFAEAIVVDIGNGAPKEKYTAVARSKANIVWKTGKDSLYVQQFEPQLLEGGDTKWGGGIIQNGIIVAVSGLEEWADIFVAKMVAAACSALIAKQMRVMMASDTIFLA
jgi:hypothetical protein